MIAQARFDGERSVVQGVSACIAGLFFSSVLASTALHAAALPDRSRPPPLRGLRAFTAPVPQELVLKNGLRVLHLQRTRAPLVDIVAIVRAGASADPVELPGLASYTAAMLSEGAGERTAIAFADAVGALGAQIEAQALSSHAVVRLHVPSARLGDAFALFTQMLTRPLFQEPDWRRVQSTTLGAYQVQAQEPRALADLAARRALWGATHRFGTSIDGTPSALAKATTNDLRAFHNAHYRPDTTTLVVVGDVDARALRALLDATLGLWVAPGAAAPAEALSPPPPLSGRAFVTVHVPGAAQSVVRVVAPVPADVLPFSADVEVMNTLLGGSFTSRLNNNLRETHGYSYGAASAFDLDPTGNTFMVRTSVQTAVTVPALREIDVELNRIRELAAEEEIARARNLTALSAPALFDSAHATATFWADAWMRGADGRRVQRFFNDAPRVTAKQLMSTAQRVVNPAQSTVVVVGDMKTLAAELRALGEPASMSVDELLPGLKEAAAALTASAAR